MVGTIMPEWLRAQIEEGHRQRLHKIDVEKCKKTIEITQANLERFE